MALLLLVAFVAGAVSVVAFEALGLWLLICRLNRRVERDEIKDKDAGAIATAGDPNPTLYDKQGVIWILEPDKIPKLGIDDKVSTEPKKRKEILEVTPVRKFARIRGGHLKLEESDGSHEEILLKGCAVVAVSASSLSSRKWAKRYPIKLESKDASIYKGHKIIYLYLDTSWEKESWCKALRLASSGDKDKIVWFSKLSKDFRGYLASLNTGYPSFLKPSMSFSVGSTDKSIKFDNSSSKVRQFLKKLTKKASRVGNDQDERKLSGKSRSFQDLTLENGLGKMDSTRKIPNVSVDDNFMASTISSTMEPGSGSHLSGMSDGDSNHKHYDEGTLGLNLFISRLFFDVKNNNQIKSSLQSRIQRSLSTMRIPSYIGEVTCTAVDPGTLPPHILAIRVLPSDMNELWALEIDFEYLGGILLDIETRLEMRELEFEGEEARFGVNATGEVTSDLLEGFDDLGKQLKLSEETINEIKHKAEGYRHTDGPENSKGTSYASSQGSRWKSILQSITKQVSQVPISLKVRVSSLSGTLLLRIKPPPSDQIWFSFISMPDIQFNLDSFVGDYKIANTHLALFLISRFKAAIRETLVLPNSESVAIPWMLAEKNDWVGRKAAPFMWYKNNQDVSSNSRREVPKHGEAEDNRASTTLPEASHDTNEAPGPESLDRSTSSTSSVDEPTARDISSHELKAPLSKKDKMQESIDEKPEESTNNSLVFFEGSNVEDGEPVRRLGTKERMRGLGKKMGEKLEVKRRHFEEKGRSFVERMRGPP